MALHQNTKDFQVHFEGVLSFPGILWRLLILLALFCGKLGSIHQEACASHGVTAETKPEPLVSLIDSVMSDLGIGAGATPWVVCAEHRWRKPVTR